MTNEELREVQLIERKTREASCLLEEYLQDRTLFGPVKGQRLEWVFQRISSVCRELFHDYLGAHYELTTVERPFFLNQTDKYLALNSLSILLILDAIQRGIACDVRVDSYVNILIDYFNNVEGECMTAESTGILPKEESWDVEY